MRMYWCLSLVSLPHAFCGWDEKMLPVSTKMQLPKPRLRLESASSALWHRRCTMALTGQPAVPRGMCSPWLRLVISTRFCPWPAAPGSPATLLGLHEPAQRWSLPRLQVYGCEHQPMSGLGVPQLPRGTCCCEWPLCSLQPTQDPNHLLRPCLSLWASPCFGTMRLVVFRWQKRRQRLSANNLFTLPSAWLNAWQRKSDHLKSHRVVP